MEVENEYQGYSRNQYSLMVLPRFQFKIIGLVCVSSLGTVAIASWAFYYLVDRQFSRLLERSQLAPEVKTEMLNNLSLSFGYLLLLCFAFSLLMVGFSVFYSHRIAGPIYHINKILEHFNEGQNEARVTLRRGDEFMFLSDKINHVLHLATVAKKTGPKAS